MDKKLAGLFGSGGSPHHDDRCQGGAGGRAGTPASFHLSRPARPNPECLAFAKGRRPTSGTERWHADRPSCDRSPSSPSPPSRRWRLCPRRAASPSSSSSPPPSLSRVPMRQQRASPRMPFSHAVAACQTQARESYGTRAGAKFVDARLPDRLFLLEAVKKRGAAKPDFSPKRPSRPKPSPTPSRTTTNPDEISYLGQNIDFAIFSSICFHRCCPGSIGEINCKITPLPAASTAG